MSSRAFSIPNLPSQVASHPAAQRTLAERATLILLGFGMAASVIAFISYEAAIKTQLSADQLYSAEIVKSPLYYAAYALQLSMLISAGMLALVNTDSRHIQKGYINRFA